MAQASQPTHINIPPPGSNPDTPSEMPGTPTSTTTSLSALSTTAIKDGHRGNFPQGPLGSRHSHTPSTTSLEAERADRISRLAGLERVSTLRAPSNHQNQYHNYNQAGPSGAYQAGPNIGGGNYGVGGGGPPSSMSPQTTPTSTQGFFQAQNNLTPAYFDSNGQPVAVTKLSTVGTASATESHVGDDSRTTAGDRDEDMFSTDTNYREPADSVASIPDAMDEDNYNDHDGARSTGYDDRMSDDGSASLVGFGEGAGSTVSGPIYHRRPIASSLAAAAAASGAPSSNNPGYYPQIHAWNLERTNSATSDARRDRDAVAGYPDTPISSSAAQERRDARMMDGIAADQGHEFVDTSARPPGGVGTQGREAAERIMQRLDHGESRVDGTTLGSSGRGGEALGKFYFEEDRGGDR